LVVVAVVETLTQQLVVEIVAVVGALQKHLMCLYQVQLLLL
jgi:hypothetical protein